MLKVHPYDETKKEVESLNKDVTLIAVSKYHTVSEIMELYDKGQRDFGENKVQDMLEKQEACPKDIRWHLIGHLQTNKVKYIIGKTELVHSLDRMELAEEIEKRSAKADVITNCLVQINSTGIEERFGVPTEGAMEFIKEMQAFPHIKLKGLMGMAPICDDPTPFFEDLKKLFDEASKLGIWEDGILSMGMSGDYKDAIKCGATMIRLGRCLFNAE